MEIRQSFDRLISTMGFPILVICHLYIESGPRSQINSNVLGDATKAMKTSIKVQRQTYYKHKQSKCKDGLIL